MQPSIAELAVARWHHAVNERDSAAAGAVVSDPLVADGPRGFGPMTAGEFVDWVGRSPILIRPVAFHPFGDRLIVVEQEARQRSGEPAGRLSTMFRVTDGLVSATLGFSALDDALAFAGRYVVLAATD